MLNQIAKTGQKGMEALERLGSSGYFLMALLWRLPNLRMLLPSVWRQLYFVGVLSLVVIVVSGFFIGMVIGLQGHHTLEKFGATSQLGQLLALSIARELGPVVSALLFAGRAGSALTAEIGLMKTTEQLASMDMMGVSPLARIVYPRFLAGLISLPLLTLIFSAVAVYGGYFVGVERLGVDAGSFWANMQSSVDFKLDVLSGMIKSVVFAFLVTWVAVFQGFSCVPTAEGVSEATTRSVVYASLLVLGFDFLLTALMIGGW
jgi:phospholipid/cholesterol/gamma-HCH transport system permease protein